MLANWVKETTTTTGTGPVTMSAISGFASFSDYFATNDVVYYVIEDANGTSREEGMGTITSSTTLSRTLPKVTLVGGTIDDTSPTALTLTAGTHTIYISALQGAQPPVDTWLPSGYKDLSDNLIHLGAQSDTVSANRATYCPMALSRARLITNIGVHISTADGAATISKLGIYTCSPDGKPANLIESVSIDVTTTGTKSVALAAPRLLSGVFFSCFVTDGTPTVRATVINNTMQTTLGVQVSIPRRYVPYETLSSWSDLPAAATPIQGENYAPIMYWS